MPRVDRSGPLRHGMQRDVDPAKAMVDLPALAVIMRYVAQRPFWAAKQPFPVPAELYDAGEQEMRELMKKRGFPLAVCKELDRDGVKNFMVLGTPVVIEVKA